MVTSNEPGFYADGRFGIRIESLIICNEAGTPNRFGGVRCVFWFCLVSVRCCPPPPSLVSSQPM